MFAALRQTLSFWRAPALLGYSNDLGLLAEEIDPDTGSALGNFPQAFTHIGLINAALTLAEVADQDGSVSANLRQGTPVGVEVSDELAE